MNPEEKTYWQIHDYLKGTLEGEELSSFKERLAIDASLQEELALHQLTNTLVINNRLREVAATSLATKKNMARNAHAKKLLLGIGILTICTLGIYSLWPTPDNRTSSSTPHNKYPNEDVRIIEETPTNEPAIEKVIAQTSVKTDLPIVSQPSTTVLPEQQKEEEIIEALPATQSKHIEPSASANNVAPVINEPKTLPSAPNEQEILCSKTKLSAAIHITNACKSQTNGIVHVSSFKGGQAPYSFEVRSMSDNRLHEKDKLSKGNYQIVLFDRNHCATVLEVIKVKEVICEEAERAFNPFLGETLELGSLDKAGDLTIFEKGGQVVYRKDFVANEKIEWNGMSQHGDMETGHFVYEINLHDGTKHHGTITVTR